MSRKRNIPFLSSGSSLIHASIKLSSVEHSAMKVSGTKPFCASDTNWWTTVFSLLASTFV